MYVLYSAVRTCTMQYCTHALYDAVQVTLKCAQGRTSVRVPVDVA